jgi:MFS family permease
MNSARSWLIFAVGTFTYLVAVTQRSSLGVAGVEATERFEISAAQMSTLAVVQLIMYAALQIPVGVALDRVGAKSLLLTGSVLMVVGQVILAFAPTFALAIVGRVLVGSGDATIFISVMRLLASWFTGRALPQVSQWLGTVGQFGQVLSAVPLSWLLREWGWAPAYLWAGSLSALCVIVVTLLISNGVNDQAAESLTWKATLRQLREALGRPGTQLGFWSHFVTQSPSTVFALLWGFPFLSVGLGYGPRDAASLLTLIVFAGAVAGPIMGMLTARYPMRRSNIVIAAVLPMAIAWAAVLLWPGVPPLWLIIVLVIVNGAGGPGSIIGFDFARTFNPTRSLGSANGVVNVGGFAASFTMMFLIGVILDLLNRAAGGSGDPAELYSLDHFRIAFSVQFLVVGLGMIFLFRARARTRRGMKEEGIEPGPLWVALLRRLRRRGR